MTKTISEHEIALPTLELLASHGGYMNTSELIEELAVHLRPQGRDAQILRNRHDTHFSQKVRNQISHRTSSTNIIRRGYVQYTGDGLQLTDKGRQIVELAKRGDTR
ncbi:MAG: hypothetical protein RJS97_20325 [Parvibaculaceae bacterium]